MPKNFLCVGVIIAPFGIKGEVKVRVFTEDVENLFDFDALFLKDHNQVKLSYIRAIDSQTAIARIDGVKDRTQAEAWRQKELFINRADLPDIKQDDAFYIEDLIGLKIKASTGEILGEITGIFNFGASDVIEFFHDLDQKKYMVPLIPDAVLDVQIEAGFVLIEPTYAI